MEIYSNNDLSSLHFYSLYMGLKKKKKKKKSKILLEKKKGNLRVAMKEAMKDL